MSSFAGGQRLSSQDLKDRFPTLAHKVYLNSGSYGLLSVDVQMAYQHYLNDRLTKGADWPGWIARIEKVRESVATLLSCESGEIALTSSASDGLNAIASAKPFSGKRNRVLVSNFEFPTTSQVWHAQRARGAEVVHVPEDAPHQISTDSFEALIDERTALVVATHVCYRNGAKLDIKRLAEVAHRHGALLLLDCYQSAGANQVNVKDLGVDFAVGGMLKYLLGSAGMGYLYVDRRHLANLIPTTTGWFAQEDRDAMNIFANCPASDARRFQSGTPPIPVAYAVQAGLAIIHEYGSASIERHVTGLASLCLERLANAGYRSETPSAPAERGPLVTIASTNEGALVDYLATRNIVVSSRNGNVRVGLHFYNDEEDLDRLFSALRHLEHYVARV
jgi:selenocysteine lyase/cysteine desulfurase